MACVFCVVFFINYCRLYSGCFFFVINRYFFDFYFYSFWISTALTSFFYFVQELLF